MREGRGGGVGGGGGGGRKRKEWTETKNIKLKTLYKCMIANTSAIRQQGAHTTYQLASPSCSTKASIHMLD